VSSKRHQSQKPRAAGGARRDVDIASRVLREFDEVQRRREVWAIEHAFREQLGRLTRDDRKEER
jgi:hypothetical protein